MIDERFYKTYTHSASETAKQLWFFVHSVGWFQCKPQYDMNRQLFDFQLKYVIRGHGKVQWHGKTYSVGPGDIFYLDLNQKHRYYADPKDPFEVLWVHFGGVQANDYFHLLDGNTYPIFTVHNPEATEALFHQLYETFKYRQVGQEAIASAIITQILTNLIILRMKGGEQQPTLEAPSYPESIQQAIYFMENNFSYPLKLEDIAKETMLSTYYFSRLFKRATGYSVMEYLQKFRMNQAKNLLINKNISINEVASQCGFSEQSYFGKMFKRYEKQTPRAYREDHSNLISY